VRAVYLVRLLTTTRLTQCFGGGGFGGSGGVGGGQSQRHTLPGPVPLTEVAVGGQ
jgi:hypothetical protein